MRTYMTLILGVALLMGSLHIRAMNMSPNFGLEYDTEWQTDFRGAYNWVNLLRLNGSLNFTPDLAIRASTISVAKTAPESLIDDLQGFSNIEADNLPLGIALLGLEYHNRRSTFFIGIRNVGEDYFTSPVTSLFVNSSCGIFPTLSGNYDIANYPLSSWCFHYKAEWEKVTFQTSLYEGLGHSQIAGPDNVFIFSPSRDGIFSISSADYDNNGSNYTLGCALYYGVCMGDAAEFEEETPEASAAKKRVSVAPWVNVEQRLTDACSILGQASFSTSKTGCRYYFGLGSSYTLGKATFGLFADYAKYSVCSEIAAEMTCNISLSPIISIQPAFEVIHSCGRTNFVGVARVSIRL